MARAALLAFAAVLLLLLSTTELAVSKADGHCNMTDSGLMACLLAINGTPMATCCAALAKADLTCLCKLKDNPTLRQLATHVPALCKLTVPKGC